MEKLNATALPDIPDPKPLTINDLPLTYPSRGLDALENLSKALRQMTTSIDAELKYWNSAAEANMLQLTRARSGRAAEFEAGPSSAV